MRLRLCAPAAVLVGFAAAAACRGETPLAEANVSRVSTYRPVPAADPAAKPDSTTAKAAHPLTSVIDYARQEQKYLGETVRDFTCRLIKRERINGYLQDMHFIDMEVREGEYQNGQIVQPLSLYLHFLGPKEVVGRNIIYVEGQNEGKLLVRNGGKHFDYVIAKIDPLSDTAKQETLVPVTDVGFDRLLDKMIEVLDKHRQIDTTGSNTKAERISGAKINNRACTVIRITHPRPMNGLEFHMANVFVDDGLHAPVRVDYSDFPKTAGGKPPLIAEYTYTNLQLNVDLPNNSFNSARLRE
jgi:hypothetical protein